MGSQLQEFLTRGGYLALTLTNAIGQVKIVGQDGKQIEPCGRLEGTQIIGKCNQDFAMVALTDGQIRDFLAVRTSDVEAKSSLGEHEVTILASRPSGLTQKF